MVQEYKRSAWVRAGRLLAVFLLAVLAAVSISGYASAAVSKPMENSPKVIMLVVNRVNLNDLTNSRYQNIQRLIGVGGLGLTTINTGGDFSDMNAYISIGAGDKLIGSAQAGESYNRDEILPDGSRAYQAYQRNTGRSAGPVQVLNISIAASLIANVSKHILSVPGALGTALHKAGLRTAVIGSSDLAPDGPPNRLVPMIAMDEWGRVDLGNVGRELLVKDPSFPYGWRTNWGKLESELNRVLPLADFIVVETGDTERVDEAGSNQLKRMTAFHRARALAGLDRFVGGLLPLVSRDIMVMLVVPLPDAQALREGLRLAPLVVAGGQIMQGSILTSPTTRQSGLVANYDIAAAVTDHLKTDPGSGMLGIPIQSIKAKDSQESVVNLAKWLTAAALQRDGVLFYFIRYQWIVYIFIFVYVLTGTTLNFRKPAGYLLTGILLYPLAILLLPLAGQVKPWVTVAGSLLLLILITYIFNRIKSHLWLFVAAAAANILTAVTDVLTGGYLMNRAALSYDMVAGGRFYGIGNEYMGVVVGAAILGTASLLQLRSGYRKQLLFICGAVFAGLIVFFAAPTVGSKAGGAITAAVGFFVALYLYSGQEVSLKSVLVILAALLGGVAVLAVFNHIVPVGEQSHIGRAFADLSEGNFGAIREMVFRKVSANYYLLLHSPFSRILFLQVMVWAAIFYRQKSRLAELEKELPYFRAGITAMFWGAAAAVLLNDSGIIGAPLMLNYLFCPLVLQLMSPRAAGTDLKP